MSEQEIYIEAMNRRDPAERQRFLDEACSGNAMLRERLEKLIQHAKDVGSFLESPPLGVCVDPTDIHPISEMPGTRIGPYKLLEQIGEGGMGTVFMAEQQEPVKRRVALKVIKLGMDTRQVIARFEAERQALTLMDHPNIAKVLDAGTTDSGRPYFVMELVKGQPITQYCDEHHLSARQRLELLIPVCQAIQHAHQKGIIHRDIKPTNILVAEYDQQPVPKVIDFGVAKATSQSLTEKTMFTGLGQIVGTLEYMSPEQAKVNQLDIDTRSDVYSLGVLLYELLTGSTPFDRNRLRSAAFDEMLRIIREEEPPKPSTRLSDTQDSLASISAQRHTEPAKLTKLVRGELDWIVMKALEKDRNRRYETANGFASDIQRYLLDEPVQACPPSAAYQLRKFVKRNRPQVIAGGMVAGAMVLGLIGTSIGMVWALNEKARANASAVSEAAQRQVADAQKKKAEQAEADTLADYRASTDDAIEKLIGGKPNLGPQESAYLEKTLKRWQAFAARQGDDERSQAIRAEGHRRVADLWQHLGQRDKAFVEYGTARDLYKKLVAAYPIVPEYLNGLAACVYNLGVQLNALGQYDAALTEYESARDLHQKLVAAYPTVPRYQGSLANSHLGVGNLLYKLERHDAVLREYETFRDLSEKLVADFPTLPEFQQILAKSHNAIGVLLMDRGQHDAARAEFETARDLSQKLVADFPSVIDYQQNLAHFHFTVGRLLQDRGQHVEARAEYESARDTLKKLADAFPAVPEYHLRLAATRNSLGSLLVSLGQRDAAVMELEAAINLQKNLTTAFPTEREYQVLLGGGYCNYASMVCDEGRPADSLHWFDLAIATLTPAYEQDRREVQAKEFLWRSHLGRSRAYKRLENYAEWSKDLVKAIELDPKNAELHCERGRVLIDQKIPDQAVVAFQQAIDVDPKCVTAYVNLGLIMHRQMKLNEAIAAFRQAIKVDPKYVNAYIYLGSALYDQEKFDEAIAIYRKAIELEPKTVKAYVNLGSALNHQEKFDEAIVIYRKRIELEPKSARACIDLALVLQAQKKLDEAVAAFRKAVELDSEDPSTLIGTPSAAEGVDLPEWLACACSLVQAEDTEGYRKLCDRLLERFGQSPDVHQIALLAHICVLAPHALADSDRVVQLAERRNSLTADIDEHKHWSMHVLGLAYYRAGEMEQAVARLEAGRKEPGLSPEIEMSNWLVLAMCRRRQGQDGEAAAAFQSAQAILASAQGEPHREKLIPEILFSEAERLLREP